MRPSYDLLLTQVTDTLTKLGATVTRTAQEDNGTTLLVVNGYTVLVRQQYNESPNVVVELYHENNCSQWVRSWGMTSAANYLLVVDVHNAHYWYDMGGITSHANYIMSHGLPGTLQNNSTRTRKNNGPSSNVMCIRVSKSTGYRFSASLDNADTVRYSEYIKTLSNVTDNPYYGHEYPR